MSLFKVRDWWSTSCGSGETFDRNCLCIGNLDNSADCVDKIIVGSQLGMLRIYLPCATQQDGGSTSIAPKPDSLLLEMKLSSPILQITVGQLVSSSENIHLAVLHPRKLAIFTLTVVSGTVDHGTNYLLSLAYEHNLKRSAFSLAVGPFGKVKGRDFMCVQSLDGALTFFEQESFAFTCFLPGFLLPGPLAYVSRTDSLVTVSSSYQLESYKYQNLAVASNSNGKQESHTGKKVTVDWAFNLGEVIHEIVILSSPNFPALICALGDRHIFCLRDSGTVRFIKRLDYQPSCCFAYVHGPVGSLFLAVVTHSKVLLLYEEMTLRWAAQLSFVPISICRADLIDLHGALILLSDQGELECSYLGTTPAMLASPPVDSREINYSETGKEMEKLQKIIRDSQKSGALFERNQVTDLVINAVVLDVLEFDSMPLVAENQTYIPPPSLMIKVTLQPSSTLKHVQITISFEKPFIISKSIHHYSDLSEAVQFTIRVKLQDGFIPSNLVGFVISLYSNGSRTFLNQMQISLPLKLIMTAATPQREALHKITLGINRSPVRLHDLFPELLLENPINTGHAVGFQIYGGGPQLTILVAKSSQRYRIQSESLEALYIIVEQLIDRLKLYFSNTMKEDLVFVISSPLPIKEYLVAVDSHFQCRKRGIAIEKQLNQAAAQFRAVQKRLLSKFKEKNPSPLVNLDLLMETTYKQITDLSQEMQMNKDELENLRCVLLSSSRLLCLLVKLSTAIGDEAFHFLENALCPILASETEQGWEEIVDAALICLLRTLYPSSMKDHAILHDRLTMPTSTDQLKQRINTVIDCICKIPLVIQESSTDHDMQSATQLLKSRNDVPQEIEAVSTATNHSAANLEDTINKLPEIHTVINAETEDVF